MTRHSSRLTACELSALADKGSGEAKPNPDYPIKLDGAARPGAALDGVRPPARQRAKGEYKKPRKGCNEPKRASWTQLALIPLDILVLDDTNTKRSSEANEPDNSGASEQKSCV